jgi:hypothetical protein
MLPCIASYHVLAAAAVATELTAGLCGFEFRGDFLTRQKLCLSLI